MEVSLLKVYFLQNIATPGIVKSWSPGSPLPQYHHKELRGVLTREIKGHASERARLLLYLRHRGHLLPASPRISFGSPLPLGSLPVPPATPQSPGPALRYQPSLCPLPPHEHSEPPQSLASSQHATWDVCCLRPAAGACAPGALQGEGPVCAVPGSINAELHLLSVISLISAASVTI